MISQENIQKLAEATLISNGKRYPVFGLVLLESDGPSVRATGRDLDARIVVEVEADLKPFKVAVGAQTFRAAAMAITGDADMAANRWDLTLKADGVIAQVHGGDPKGFPEWANEESREFPLPDGFMDTARRTVFCASTDETRYVLNGLHLDGQAMVATDGRRLAYSDFPLDGLDGQLIVATTTLGLLTSPTMMRVGQSQVEFVEDGKRVSSKLIQGTYPNWRKVVPTNLPSSISTDRDGLIAAIRDCAGVSNDTHKIHMGSEKGELRLSCEDSKSGRIQRSIEFEGDDGFDVSVNPKYLLDGLKYASGDDVSINFKDGKTPITIGSDGWPYVLMPMRGGK